MQTPAAPSALRDGAREGALSGSDPVRLFLSGGGHRASLGGVGAISALHGAQRWADVTEVVSVSGGSLLSGAVLGLHDPGDPVDDPLPALGRFVARLLDDPMRLVGSPRRAGLVAGVGLTVLGAVVLGAMVAGVIGPDGWWRSGWVGLLLGVAAFPVVLSVTRVLASAMWGDWVHTVTGGRHVALAGSGGARRHVFCASGLSSAVPYYFWSHGSAPSMAWGEPIQAGYTVSDAVRASTTLPGMRGVRAPEEFRGELLVDGGLSGIFGEQIESELQRDPQSTWRGDHQRLAVDGGRHAMSDRPLVRRLGGISVGYTVVRWLQASLEATYVNDLADWRDTELVRLSVAPGAEGTSGQSATDPVARAIATGQAATAHLGLFALDAPSADRAIVVGYAGTARALDPAITAEAIEAGLAEVGPRLGRAASLASCWRALVDEGANPDA